SHELRTPLTSIRGALGLMVGGVTGPLPALAQEHAGLALKNAERLIRMVSDLLDLEKLQSGSLHLRLRAAPLAPLVEEAVQANRGYAAALRIELVVPGALPPAHVLVDPDRFEQVLTNLISNAAKYSPAGGVVEVGASVQAGRVRVTVRDHGPGVPADFEGRIFERFAQADGSNSRRQGGTGLGLSITRGLVERMGGSIGFERPEGGGARFFVELPIEDLAHPA
ncbi:MAG TPA: ATP-binding protein, partial [Archangium sp.]